MRATMPAALVTGFLVASQIAAQTPSAGVPAGNSFLPRFRLPFSGADDSTANAASVPGSRIPDP